MPYRLLPRPPLPDMPLHVLDWGRTPPPVRSLPRRLRPDDQRRLAGTLLAYLQEPVSWDALTAEAAARLDDADWSPDHHVPFFQPRRGRHPDVGWSFTRLTCPDRWERWAAEDDWNDDEFWYFEEGEGAARLEVRPDHLLVSHWSGELEIYPDRLVLTDDYYDSNQELGLLVQGLTGLACYTDADHLVFDPVICAVCKTFFLLWEREGEHQGCPTCGAEWVHVLP